MTVALLRRRGVDGRALSKMWLALRDAPVADRACPHCRQAMRRTAVEGDGADFPLDGCRACHLLWFDSGELEAMPLARPADEAAREVAAERAEAAMPEEARVALAMAQARRIREQADDLDNHPPLPVWKMALAFFGMPVELDEQVVERPPVATYALAIGCALTLALTYVNLEQAVANWGLVPSAWGRHGGLTFVTSFFLHGGLIHLAANLYFLLAFGDNVEGVLGTRRFLGLVAVSAFAGDLAHAALDPGGHVPLVGASGGIYGVLVFYTFAFPQARVGIFFRFVFIPMRIWVMLLLYMGFQLLGGFAQAYGAGGGTSYLAHLGGGVAGGLYAWVTKRHGRGWGTPGDEAPPR